MSIEHQTLVIDHWDWILETHGWTMVLTKENGHFELWTMDNRQNNGHYYGIFDNGDIQEWRMDTKEWTTDNFGHKTLGIQHFGRWAMAIGHLKMDIKY